MTTVTEASARAKPLLQVSGLSVQFGGLLALDNASFSVAPGECCGLIGPNGAGKTTLFNCVSGFVRPTHGTVWFADRDLLGTSKHNVISLGVARTFQQVGLVPSLSVLENVMLGAFWRTRGGFLSSPFIVPWVSRSERRVREDAFELLDVVELRHWAHHAADGLPYGTLKRIELARALMAGPRILLLDEPANGLTHSEVDNLRLLLTRLRDQYEFAILLVEHHMGFVMGLCDKVVVLDSGRVIATGTPTEIRSDPAVIGAYLGSAP